jgi:hypothetical protein
MGDLEPMDKFVTMVQMPSGVWFGFPHLRLGRGRISMNVTKAVNDVAILISSGQSQVENFLYQSIFQEFGRSKVHLLWKVQQIPLV